VSFAPRPLYPQGKSPWYPLDRRLGRPQSRSGRGGKEKNSQPLPEIEPRSSDRQACSQSLYRLSYPGSHCLCGRLNYAATHQLRNTGWSRQICVLGVSNELPVVFTRCITSVDPLQRCALCSHSTSVV
jgi:hypothetical protein